MVVTSHVRYDTVTLPFRYRQRHRYRLLKVEVAATAVGTAMGIGAVTTGMLGMNLKTPLFDSDEFK